MKLRILITMVSFILFLSMSVRGANKFRMDIDGGSDRELILAFCKAYEIVNSVLPTVDGNKGASLATVYLNAKANEWVFVYSKGKVDSGFMVFLKKGETSFLEIQRGGATWRERVDIKSQNEHPGK